MQPAMSENQDQAQTFVVVSSAGIHRDLSKGSREQRYWDEHEVFIDALVDRGFIMMGGPFDDGGAMLVVRAESEDEVRETMGNDPWYQRGILNLDSIRRWQIFIDRRETS
jgi:uncharacterized protein YciI